MSSMLGIDLQLSVIQVAADRKSRLKRFGEATKEQAGDSVTVQQAEDIPFDRVQKSRQTTEEKRAEKEDLRSALQGSDKSAVVGRCAPLLNCNVKIVDDDVTRVTSTRLGWMRRKALHFL